MYPRKGFGRGECVIPDEMHSILDEIEQVYFRTEEFGSVKLFVNTQKPPFIYLHTTERITIFNMETPEQTEATYDEILKVLAGKHQ